MVFRIAQLSSIGLAVIDELGYITDANQAFCEIFAIGTPKTPATCTFCEHIGSRFKISCSEFSELIKSAEAAIFELRLQRNADPLIVHLAKLCEGRRIIVVDSLPKSLFEPLFAQRAILRRQIETDLRQALELGQFTLVYQPQVQIRSRKLIGFEALIRWQHPQRGLISPTEFIPLAEEIGIIHEIGAWVMHTACMTAKTWDGEYSIAVNVSPIQFESDRICKVVQEALASSGLPPERLEIEITEGVLIKDPAIALKHLWTIKSLGVGIALDDFGTGYSSLSYLNSFPFSKLKIDQSFVRGENSLKSRAFIRAIVALGESLSMNILAEGVETEDQFMEMSCGGCTGVQGFLISHPIPSVEIAEFIAGIGS